MIVALIDDECPYCGHRDDVEVAWTGTIGHYTCQACHGLVELDDPSDDRIDEW